jgi:type I restriction enzyme R subunit
LDVLKHVIIYKLNAGELIKTAEDNPTLPVNKTVKQIKEQIIRCDPKSIKVKCEKIAEYFKDFTLPSCGGVGKAMIVAPSVKTVIEYKKQLETTFKDKSIPKQKILVAYTGEVKGQTETEVNGFSENKTASEFSNDDCRILIVCNKYQTGFDEKKLTTLFVDQPLSGVRAVQTYSRLNRTFRNSKETLIIDFVNALDDIQNSFKPFMKTTELESQFDSKIFLDCLNELASYNFFTESELKEFNTLLMFKFSNQKDLKNQNIELADLSNIINKKIHDINKFSDQQILDNEKKIRYFVK